MMERLRNGLWRLRQRLRFTGGRPKKTAAPIKGSIRNVIVVKPENKMFSQAFFVLNDDYLRQSSLSSQELLRQAREATGEYSGSLMPHRKNRAGLWALLLILAGAALLGAGYYFIIVYTAL